MHARQRGRLRKIVPSPAGHVFNAGTPAHVLGREGTKEVLVEEKKRSVVQKRRAAVVSAEGGGEGGGVREHSEVVEELAAHFRGQCTDQRQYRVNKQRPPADWLCSRMALTTSASTSANRRPTCLPKHMTYIGPVFAGHMTGGGTIH